MIETKRKAYYRVKKILDENRIPILIGLRRTGKTTILKQIQNENKDQTKIITCDDIFIRRLTDLELLDLIDMLITKEHIKYIFLDEIQIRNNWDIIVKNLFDRYVSNNSAKFIITGSSSLSFEKKDTGVTRTEKVLIHTLDFQEYLEFSGRPKNFDEFEHYLTHGPFPEFINKDISIEEMINLSLAPIINDDIPANYRVNIELLLRFIYELSSLTNGELNILQSSKSLGVKTEQIYNYLDILKQTHIVKVVEKINVDLTFDRYRKFKVYINPHFHLWLLKKEFANVDNKMKGHIIESYWLYWATQINGYYKNYYYLKTKDNKEIDFVSLSHGQKKFKTLHEFKYVDKVNLSDLKLLTEINAENKVVWCKENKKVYGIKFISILDAEDN